jgi:predicted O-methyltransferase YrrM
VRGGLRAVPPGRRLRYLRQGLATLFGLAPRGFFLPYAGADSVPETLRPYAAVEAVLAAHREAFLAVLDAIDAYGDDLRPLAEAAPPAPRFAQGWFPPLDAAAAYALVRTRRPGRIVEVGSGHSTRFLARAVADEGLDTEITAIDPNPRADIAALPVTALRQPVQAVPAAVFAALGPGDVLFIDSSHLAMPGTDVDLLVGRVIPALPAGVLVHVHDIALPDPYPDAWAWRGYNEHLPVIALLAGGFRPVFASHYAATRLADRVDTSLVATLPCLADARDGSLWLEKTTPPIGPVG